MAENGTWFEFFDDDVVQVVIAWTGPIGEFVDEHQHFWEAIGDGSLECVTCHGRHRIPRRRALSPQDRRKPGER
jgi:hypothetical protein